jgi:hypothetical protein
MNAVAAECAAVGVLINAVAPVAATRVYAGPEPERFARQTINVVAAAYGQPPMLALARRCNAVSFAQGLVIDLSR